MHIAEVPRIYSTILDEAPSFPLADRIHLTVLAEAVTLCFIHLGYTVGEMLLNTQWEPLAGVLFILSILLSLPWWQLLLACWKLEVR